MTWFKTDEAKATYTEQARQYNRTQGRGNCVKCIGKGIRARVVSPQGVYGVSLENCPYCKGTGNYATDIMNGFKTETDWQVSVMEKAKKYLEEDGAPWFFLGGQVGAGKTHICMGILQRLKGDSMVFYWNIESQRLKGFDADTELIKRFQNAEILMIDDFLCGSVTDGDINLARRIVDYRYNKGLRTLFTSEKQNPEVRDVAEGLSSRITEMTAGGRYCISLKNDDSKDYRRKQ